jgi:ankyrin repeat protein/predicted esterase
MRHGGNAARHRPCGGTGKERQMMRLTALVSLLLLVVACSSGAPPSPGQPAAGRSSTTFNPPQGAIISGSEADIDALLASGFDPAKPYAWPGGSRGLAVIDLTYNSRLNAEARDRVLKRFIAHGADVNAVGPAGQTALGSVVSTVSGSSPPLDTAAHRAELVHLLAVNGARVNPPLRPGAGHVSADDSRFPVMQIVESSLPLDDKRVLLKELFADGADPNVRSLMFNMTPLEFARHVGNSNAGDPELAALLVQAGARDTPESQAASASSAVAGAPTTDSVVAERIVVGDTKFWLHRRHQVEPVKVPPIPDAFEAWQTQAGAEKINPNVPRTSPVLLEKLRATIARDADVNARNQFGTPALVLMARSQDPRLKEAIEALLARGADVNAQDAEGTTPLMALVISLEPDQLETSLHQMALLFAHGADPNLRDKQGRTVVFHVADSNTCNDPRMLELLLSKGADISAVDDDGLTPLGRAQTMNCPKMAAWLKQHGATSVGTAYPTGNTAAAVQAVLHKDLRALRTLPVADFAKVEARTRYEVPATALHVAVELGDPEVLAELARRKVDWNARDRYGRTPLHLAVLSGNRALVGLLLDHGADPNVAESVRGQTPLGYAVSLHPELAEYILSRGYAPGGPTPLLNAIVTENEALARRLLPTADKSQPGRYLETAALRGSASILQALDRRGLQEPGVLTSELVQLAGLAHRAIEAPVAAAPPPVVRQSAPVSGRKGTFQYVLTGWSPQAGALPDRELDKFPVSVYVPRAYSGAAPYGLLVFVHATKAGSTAYPNAGYRKVLDAHHLIWASFSAYNGIFQPFAERDYHVVFMLAVVHEMRRRFNVDPGRIYLAGFSWGAQIVAANLPRYADVFQGGIVMGGSGDYGTPNGLAQARRRQRIVFSAGDYDPNRIETFDQYSSYLLDGFRHVHFMQDPGHGHSLLSPPLFEQALRFLESPTP